MTKRIGPRMETALEYIASNPGCTKLAAATTVAQYARYPGTSQHAFAAVNRCIRARLVRAERKPSGAYSLTVAQ